MHNFLFYNVAECNKLIIKQEFVHEVGQLIRKYCTVSADTDTSIISTKASGYDTTIVKE